MRLQLFLVLCISVFFSAPYVWTSIYEFVNKDHVSCDLTSVRDAGGAFIVGMCKIDIKMKEPTIDQIVGHFDYGWVI